MLSSLFYFFLIKKALKTTTSLKSIEAGSSLYIVHEYAVHC